MDNSGWMANAFDTPVMESNCIVTVVHGLLRVVGNKEVDSKMAVEQFSVVDMEHMVEGYTAVECNRVDLNFLEYNTDTYFPIFVEKKKNLLLFFIYLCFTGSKWWPFHEIKMKLEEVLGC